MVPVVTSVRDAGTGRVAVELDGSPWRVLPVEAAARSGLDVGVAVDRPRARRLRMELRRSEALAIAVKSLRFRDHSSHSLADRLAHASVDAASGSEVISTLERVGLLDDQRSAHARATALADRDAGDLLIRADLEQRGFLQHHVFEAIAALPPEAMRAEQIVSRRGASPKTFRRLAAKGFSGDALDGLIADGRQEELG